MSHSSPGKAVIDGTTLTYACRPARIPHPLTVVHQRHMRQQIIACLLYVMKKDKYVLVSHSLLVDVPSEKFDRTAGFSPNINRYQHHANRSYSTLYFFAI
jgi:hypothetical protein